MKMLRPFALLTLLVSPLACTVPAEPEADLSRSPTESAFAEQDTGSQRQRSGVKKPTQKNAGLQVEVVIAGDAREEKFVEEAMSKVADIYAQCDTALSTTLHYEPEELSNGINTTQRYELTRKYTPADTIIRQPTVFVVNSTAERDVAFSYLPSLARDISGTAWITDRVSEQCFAWIVAHEIGHVILDNGKHHPRKRNVMNARCSSRSNYNRSRSLPTWTDEQCSVIQSFSGLSSPTKFAN